MKIVSLNTWCATNHDQLEAYIRDVAPSTDVFCLQEVTRSAVSAIVVEGWHTNSKSYFDAWLSEFSSYYAANTQKKDRVKGSTEIATFDFGQAVYVRGEVSNSGVETILDGYHPTTNARRALPWVQVPLDKECLTIATLHGLWTPNKLDNPLRIDQARRSRAFFDAQAGPYVFCGDFNIRPDTQSLAIMRGNDRELVTESGMKTTRGRSYTGSEPYADYCIVSRELLVESFAVPAVDASDHLPLELIVRSQR